MPLWLIAAARRVITWSLTSAAGWSVTKPLLPRPLPVCEP